MRSSFIKTTALLSLLLLLPFAAVGAESKGKKSPMARGGLFAASDGKGEVRLMWIPPSAGWPRGGWRVEEAGTGKVVVPVVGFAEEAALRDIPAESAKRLAALRPAPSSEGKNARASMSILLAKAASEWPMARALGLATILRDVPGGAKTYRVVALSEGGAGADLSFESRPVDSSKATPLPAAPTGLSAEVLKEGVAIFFQPGKAAPDFPAIAYDIVRDGDGRSGEPVGTNPLLTGVAWEAEKPVAIDALAPVEEELSYRVSAIDVFGRRSEAATVTVLFADLTALDPPTAVTSSVEIDGQVDLSWEVVPNPYRTGFVIERGPRQEGPFTALSEDSLPTETRKTTDKRVIGGTSYYYRVRSVDPRGKVGPPSLTALAVPRTKGKPPTPTGVAVTVFPSRLRVAWDNVERTIAGWFVERKGETGGWARLSARPVVEPVFDDRFPTDAYGTFRYRVVSITRDSVESVPSTEVEAILPDLNPPPPPKIVASDGADGKVSLRFAVGLPEEKTANVLLVRSIDADDPGIVLGDPMPGSAREVTDSYVRAGKTYRYRLVALDKDGRQSEPSETVIVSVGTPPIPKPPAPTVKRVTEPYNGIDLIFTKPPESLSIRVQSWKEEMGTWVTVMRGVRAEMASDPAPPVGIARYRILYEAENGVQGEPSDPVESKP